MLVTMKHGTVNERVKLLRHALRLNQVEFANEIGISPSLISKLEVGEKASVNTLDAIIKTYSVPEEWLLKGQGEMSYSRPAGKAVENPYKDVLYKELRDQVEFLKETIRSLTGSKGFPIPLNQTAPRKLKYAS